MWVWMCLYLFCAHAHIHFVVYLDMLRCWERGNLHWYNITMKHRNSMYFSGKQKRWDVETIYSSWRAEVLRCAASRVPPSSEPPVEGIFPLELTWVLTPFHKTLSDESINWGLVCAHMHSISQTLKILIQMNAGNKLTFSMHHPQRWNVTTSMVGLKDGHMCKHSSKMVNPRDIAWNAEKEEDGSTGTQTSLWISRVWNPQPHLWASWRKVTMTAAPSDLLSATKAQEWVLS